MTVTQVTRVFESVEVEVENINSNSNVNITFQSIESLLICRGTNTVSMQKSNRVQLLIVSARKLETSKCR